MDDRLAREPTRWSLLQLRLEIDIQILGGLNKKKKTTMPFYRNWQPDSQIYWKYTGRK